MNARRILKGHVADKPRLLLVIQEERTAGNAADQMAALVGLEVAQQSHGDYYTIFHSTTTTPPLWSLVRSLEYGRDDTITIAPPRHFEKET